MVDLDRDPRANRLADPRDPIAQDIDGNAAAEFVLQNVRLANLENAQGLVERYQLALARFSTVVDTKDAYPFPTRGVGLRLSSRSSHSPPLRHARPAAQTTTITYNA